MKKISTLILAFACASLFGQSIESSGFSPATIRPDGVSSYTLTLKNIKGSIDASSIPMPKGLHIVGQNRSQNYSIVNGSMSSSTSISYTVRAEGEGTFTVPDWEIKYGKDILKIKSATLTVDKNAPQTAEPQGDPFDIFSQSPFGNMGGAFSRRSAQRTQQAQQARQQLQTFENNLRNNAKLEIKLSREKIYVGESVPCELVFSFDKSLAEQGFTLAALAPETKKADDFDCPAFSEKPDVDTTSDPARILVKYRTAITPLKVGTYDLDFSARGLFQRELRSDDMFSIFDSMMSMRNRQIPFEVNMPSKKISVLALPDEGKPASFSGAIGRFSLEDVAVEPDSLTVGEPCTITAKIAGVGNFPRIGEPKLDAGDDWKTYKAKSSFADESNGLSDIGVKTFTYTVVPKKADLEFAPQVDFSYFDPITQKYVEIKSKKVSVSVAPTGRSKRAEQKQEAAASPEPAFDKIIEGTGAVSDVRLLQSPWFWSVNILILAAVVGFVMMRRETLRRQNDKPYAKRIEYKKFCARALKAASYDVSVSDFGKFFTDARDALRYAIAADCDRDASSLTMREAEDILNGKLADPRVIRGVEKIFNGADEIEFGGMDTSKIDLASLDAELRKYCSTISKL